MKAGGIEIGLILSERLPEQIVCTSNMTIIDPEIILSLKLL
jgi:hypothetical protein